LAGDSESRTEKASPKKRRDEQKKGNIYKSQDVTNALSILAVFITLKKLVPFVYKKMSEIMYDYFTSIQTVPEITKEKGLLILRDCFFALFLMAGPVMLVALVVGVLATGAQTKFLFSKDSLKPKLSKLSPLKGIKKIISIRSVVELLKSIIKALIIGTVIFQSYKSIASNTVKLMSMDVFNSAVFVLQSVYGLVMKLSMAFVAIAVFDYLYQWWEYERGIKMSKQEVKEEYKQTEGDPLIRSRIRDTQRKMSQQRMMQQVPSADVIVRNPTHFAIALKYDIDSNSAPIVVAKGQDHLALRIIEEAEKHDIPMMEDKPLARMLYSEVELGREIPPQYYTAIAEVLAWVYSLKKES